MPDGLSEIALEESNECPACEEGYICRQGEGCILVDAFDREFVPGCDTEGL